MTEHCILFLCLHTGFFGRRKSQDLSPGEKGSGRSSCGFPGGIELWTLVRARLSPAVNLFRLEPLLWTDVPVIRSILLKCALHYAPLLVYSLIWEAAEKAAQNMGQAAWVPVLTQLHTSYNIGLAALSFLICKVGTMMLAVPTLPDGHEDS